MKRKNHLSHYHSMMITCVMLIFTGLFIACGSGGGDSGSDYPNVTIIAPKDGAIYTEGDSILFEGAATDPKDGVMVGEDLVWHSSLDGELDRSDILETNMLSKGTHKITLSVTNSENKTGSDEIIIGVNPLEVMWTELVDFEGDDDFYSILFDGNGEFFVPGARNHWRYAILGKFNSEGDLVYKTKKDFNFNEWHRIQDYTMSNDSIYMLGYLDNASPANKTSAFFIVIYSITDKSWSRPRFYGSEKFDTRGWAITSGADGSIYMSREIPVAL